MASNEEIKLAEVVGRYGFDCAVLADQDGLRLFRTGAFSNEECVDALIRAFYDPATVRALHGYLIDKEFPQLFVDGNVMGVHGLLANGSVVALFGELSGDVRARYGRAQKLWLELVR